MKKKLSKSPESVDAETFIVKTKNRASALGRDEDKIAAFKRSEVDETLQEVRLLKAKKELEDAKRGIMHDTSNQNSIVNSMFQNKTPEEIDEIISKMTPENIEKLSLLVKKLDTNPLNTAFQQSTIQAQPQRSDAQIMLDTIKLMKELEPKREDLTPILLKALVDNRNGQGGGGAMEVIKVATELNKPVIDMMKVASDSSSRKDKEIWDLKFKEIKDNQPPDLVEQVKYVKEMSGALGLGNSRSEIDLKLEEMRENKEIDMKRLDWEQEKWKMEQEADQNKWEQISKILSGPLGQAVQGIGNAGADRLRGGRGNPAAQAPKVVQTQCPNCGNRIFVDAEADTAICGNCGAILQKSGGVAQAPATPIVPTPPPPPPATPTRVNAQPEPAPANETVEEEEVDEETENGHTEGPDETESSEQ